MTIDTDRTLSVTVFRKDTHADEYLNFQSSHTLHQCPGLITTLFHRADNPVPKQNDKLSEHKHLRHNLSRCGYKHSINDHAISFDKPHISRTATWMPKNKFYVTLTLL